MTNKFNIPHNVIAAVGALAISSVCVLATVGPVNAERPAAQIQTADHDSFATPGQFQRA